jgi:hypothetical protein
MSSRPPIQFADAFALISGVSLFTVGKSLKQTGPVRSFSDIYLPLFKSNSGYRYQANCSAKTKRGH